MITRTVPSIDSTHLLLNVTHPICKRRIGKTVTSVRPGASRCYGINELYVFEHLFLFIHEEAPYKSTIHGREKRPSRHACSPVRSSVVKRYTTETRRPWCVFVSSFTLAKQSYLVSNPHTASLLHAKSSSLHIQTFVDSEVETAAGL
jgi:hypothetical protein